MNDLNQLLHDAAGSGDDHRLDPRDLLTAGKRKVRNRRLAAAGGVTAAVVAAAALATGLWSNDDRPDVVDDPSEHSSNYEEVRISPAEVERRCTTVLNLQNGADTQWVAGRDSDGTAVSVVETGQTIETREGFVANLTPAGERWTSRPEKPGADGWTGSAALPHEALIGACRIPQQDLVEGIAGAMAEPVPPASNSDGVLDLCSRRNAYDLRGWQLVTTAESSRHLVAMLMSSNGYFAACMLDREGGSALDLQGRRHLDDSGRPSDAVATDAELIEDAGDCEEPTGRDELCVVYGVVPGLPDGYRVELVTGERTLAAATSVNGAYVTISEHRSTDGVGVRYFTSDGQQIGDGRTLLSSHGGL